MLKAYTVEGYVNGNKFYFYGTNNSTTNRTHGKIVFNTENDTAADYDVSFSTKTEEVIE